MIRNHPLLLTATLLAVLCAAAAAHAQEGDAPQTWAALFGTHSSTCSGGDLPEAQRKAFLDLLLEHQRRLGELGRQLYARQLEYDALADAEKDADPQQLEQLRKEMSQLRQIMIEEDGNFARTTKKRFGLDISGGLHCAAAANASADQ